MLVKMLLLMCLIGTAVVVFATE